MHNIPLNVVGNILKELIATGKLDAKVAGERLKQFPWTAGIILLYNVCLNLNRNSLLLHCMPVFCVANLQPSLCWYANKNIYACAVE